jgi:hypothetical protein
VGFASRATNNCGRLDFCDNEERRTAYQEATPTLAIRKVEAQLEFVQSNVSMSPIDSVAPCGFFLLAGARFLLPLSAPLKLSPWRSWKTVW